MKWIIACGVAVLFLCFFWFSFEKSTLSPQIPVPKMATYQSYQSDYQTETYEWKSVTEERGIPIRYQTMLRLNGWKREITLGQMTVYRRGDEEFYLLTRDGEFSIRKSHQKLKQKM